MCPTAGRASGVKYLRGETRQRPSPPASTASKLHQQRVTCDKEISRQSSWASQPPDRRSPRKYRRDEAVTTCADSSPRKIYQTDSRGDFESATAIIACLLLWSAVRRFALLLQSESW